MRKTKYETARGTPEFATTVEMVQPGMYQHAEERKGNELVLMHTKIPSSRTLLRMLSLEGCSEGALAERDLEEVLYEPEPCQV